MDSAAADLEAAERSLNESFLRLVWSAWQLVRMSAGLLCMEQRVSPCSQGEQLAAEGAAQELSEVAVHALAQCCEVAGGPGSWTGLALRSLRVVAHRCDGAAPGGSVRPADLSLKDVAPLGSLGILFGVVYMVRARGGDSAAGLGRGRPTWRVLHVVLLGGVASQRAVSARAWLTSLARLCCWAGPVGTSGDQWGVTWRGGGALGGWWRRRAHAEAGWPASLGVFLPPRRH